MLSSCLASRFLSLYCLFESLLVQPLAKHDQAPSQNGVILISVCYVETPYHLSICYFEINEYRLSHVIISRDFSRETESQYLLEPHPGFCGMRELRVLLPVVLLLLDGILVRFSEPPLPLSFSSGFLKNFRWRGVL